MRKVVVAVGLGASLALGACRSKTDSPGISAASATAAAALSSNAPEPTSSVTAPASSSKEPAPSPWSDGVGGSARLSRCGWGALKVDPDVESPAWAIALIDVDAKDSIKGLRVAAIELSAGSDVVAKLGDRATLRVQEGAVSYSYGAANTHEVDAVLGAGPYRLRAAAALDHPPKQIARRSPTRCAVVLADAAGNQLVAAGSVDPEWENE